MTGNPRVYPRHRPPFSSVATFVAPCATIDCSPVRGTTAAIVR